MKHYYAIFKKTAKAVEVEFPDLPGCVTFGRDWEDALLHAEDVLAAWLANAEPQFIHTPSSHEQLKHFKGELVPIVVNAGILTSYQELARVNIILPKKFLQRVDTFRKKIGLKRSTLLQRAAEDYLERNMHLAA